MHDRFVLKTVPYENRGALSYLSVNHRIAITTDGRGTAEQVREKLKNSGFRFVSLVKEAPAETDVLIALEGLADFHIDAAMDCNRQLFLQAQRVAGRFSEKGGIYINVQSMAPAALFSTGQAGLAKTAAQEWPRARCLTLTIDTQGQSIEALAEHIVQHILHDNTTQECTLFADGQKTVPQLVPMATTPSLHVQEMPINKNSVLLVSGGGRGITAACLLALAKECQPTIILLGRTVLNPEPALTQHLTAVSDIKNALITDAKMTSQLMTPAKMNQVINHILAQREINQTVLALKMAGADVHYRALDILNLTELQQTVAAVRQQWGAITGIIHGAGVLADKLIAQKSVQQFDHVFNTKIIGLQNLLLATEQDPLSVLLFFSSVAARFGNIGQCDYAMANDILNNIAEYQSRKRGHSCIVKSFNWGPWETGMVTPELKTVFKKRGIKLLSVERGTQLFVEELKNRTPHVQIILGGRLDHTTKEMVYCVNEKSYGFLKSHTVEDVPVLPAALVLEWFYRMIESFSLALDKGTCRHFKVLSGVRLTHFYTAYDELKVVAEPLADEDIILLKLVGANGTVHYSAEWASFVERPVFPSLPLINQIHQSWPWQADEIYQPNPEKRLKCQLFHGDALQAIIDLQAQSDQGGRGQLLTLQQKNWGNEHFKTDVLMMDGVLQLLRLWSFTQLNYPTLPTKINEFVLYLTLLPAMTKSLYCTFTAQVYGKYRTVSNAWLHDHEGQLYAYLSGVEMCAVQIN